MAPYAINVRVVKVGTCTIDPGNMASNLDALKGQLGIGGGSTVVLIREAGATLLVDTGYDREWDASAANVQANEAVLLGLVGQHGVQPKDVTHVFLTHFHQDHSGNLHLFPQAQRLCHRVTLAEHAGPLKERFRPVEEGEELIPRTTILHTPGHTRGHASLL